MSSPIDGRIPRSNLGETIYLQLWERILARRLHPGEKLSDLKLSRELGVSRTPVREALQRLVSDGIVRAEPNRGFYIATFSSRDIAEVYDLRAALEGMALRLSAPRLTPEDIQVALDQFEEIERLVGASRTDEEWLESTRRFLETDRGFHRLLVERSENLRLETIMEGLWAQIAVFQRAGLFRRSWLDVALSDHRRIISALKAGQFDEASVFLGEHIEHVKRLVIDLADPNPGNRAKEHKLAEPAARGWRYRIEIDPSEQSVSALGVDGWELTAIDPRDGRFFFKRPGPTFRDRVTLEQKVRYYALWAREREAKA